MRGKESNKALIITSGIVTVVILTTLIEGIIILSAPEPSVEAFRGLNMLGGDPSPSKNASFNPPHSYHCEDTDLDGKYNLLVFNVSVTIFSNCTISVSGCLHYIANNDTGLDYSPGEHRESEPQILTSGNYTITLSFRTIMIHKSERIGMWFINLSLIDEDEMKIIDEDSYIINSLNCNDFDIPDVIFDVPISDYGYDNNTDSIYDWLIINFTLNVTKNGTYRLIGGAINNNWTNTFQSTYSILSLKIGIQMRKLWINVTGDSFEIGPYYVYLKISNMEQEHYDEITYETTLSSFTY